MRLGAKSTKRKEGDSFGTGSLLEDIDICIKWTVILLFLQCYRRSAQSMRLWAKRINRAEGDSFGTGSLLEDIDRGWTLGTSRGVGVTEPPMLPYSSSEPSPAEADGVTLARHWLSPAAPPLLSSIPQLLSCLPDFRVWLASYHVINRD